MANCVRALGTTGGRRWSAVLPGRRRKAASHRGSPRPMAETGGRADPSQRFTDGEGNAQILFLL